MIFETFPVGPLQCNCVILGCEKTREALVIDPGDESEFIESRLKELNLKSKYLLHTHAHFDHVGATASLKAQGHGKICLHKEDQFLYDNLPMQGKLFGIPISPGAAIEHYLEDEETFSFGAHKLRVLHTPGHTPGSVCFYVEDSKSPWLFSGDTLFQGSIGRTDLWGGDSDKILKSIRTRIFTLDESTQIIAGHGDKTSISIEKRTNPFFI